MGRITTYLTILIVMDILFIITGQLCTSPNSCTLTSAIFSSALNPSQGVFSNWFRTMIGNIGDLLLGNPSQSPGVIASILSFIVSGAGVAATALFFGLRSDAILFAPAGFALSLLLSDFIAIYSYLASYSPIMALLLMSPIAIIYAVTCVEWVRGMP